MSCIKKTPSPTASILYWPKSEAGGLVYRIYMNSHVA